MQGYKINQTEQTAVNAAWEQNIVFQEVEKPEIFKCTGEERPEPGGPQSARCGRSRHQQVRPNGCLVCTKPGQRREGLCAGPGIVDICNEALKQNRLYLLQRSEAGTERKYVFWIHFGGESLDGRLICSIEPDVSTQYDWFAPEIEPVWKLTSVTMFGHGLVTNLLHGLVTKLKWKLSAITDKFHR